MYEIEKGIPAPRSKYPFDHMEVGDSFLISCEPEEAPRCQRRISGTISRLKKNRSRYFVTRKVEGGVRVWRIK